jgi:hypothetical protein
MLQRGWAVLGPSGEHRFASFPLDVLWDREPCRLAVDRVGTRHLLVPVGGEHAIATQRGSALVVEQRWLVFGRSEHVYFDLSCVEPELYVEFDDVVEDVVDAVQDAADSGQATLEVVARWRRLFKAGLVRGLGAEATRGLFAELSMLTSLVDADPRFDVSMWTGPLGQPHDFELAGDCVEVKALGVTSTQVRIHGLEQLDAHDGRPLHLALLTVVDDVDGRSIDDLALDLERRIGDPELLKRRLAATGWTADSPAHDEKYRLGQVSGIHVTAATPRLVPTSLIQARPPDGVDNVDYSIERDALAPLVTSASLADIAREVVM